MRLIFGLLLPLLFVPRGSAADWLDRMSNHEHCAAHYQILSLFDGAFGDEVVAHAAASRAIALKALAEIDEGGQLDNQWYRDAAALWPTPEFFVGKEFGRKIAAIVDQTQWEFCSKLIDGVQKFQCTMAPNAFFDRETFHGHVRDLINERGCKDLLLTHLKSRFTSH